ncbi:hypothetical protein AB0O76_20900 [Streptomyces sp. NPDC086554]|uniref:hypothetical protein n=1 Tax=Streptomyces sp. NPDC086554 TaxID=3154864 RepID=UPI003430E38B
MSRRRAAANVIATAAAVMALMGAGQAFGDAGENLDSSTVGSKTWSHENIGNKNVKVMDTEPDSHPVYSLYDRRTSTGKRLDNHKGNGETAKSGDDSRNYVTKVTACVNVQLSPDRCGSDDRPGDGR